MSDGDGPVLYLIKDEVATKKRKGDYGKGTIRQRGKVFYIGYRSTDPATGVRKQKWEKIGTSREAAEHALLEKQMLTSQGREGELAGTLFSSLADDWLVSKQVEVEPKTLDLYRWLVERLKDVWGNTYLHQIDFQSVEIMRAQMLETHSPQSVAHQMNVARQIFRRGVSQRLIAYNPAAEVKRPKITKARPTVLNEIQVRKLFGALPDQHKMLFRTLTQTGMRIGEALGLTVDDWDSKAHTLSIWRTIKRSGGKTYLPDTGTKTAAGQRVLRVSPEFAAQMDLHIAASDDIRQKSDLGLIFPSTVGTVINPSNLRNNVFAPACEKAGISDTHMHVLRHTWASEQIASGKLDIPTISGMLGHASSQVTLGTYSHEVNKHQSKVATLGLYDEKTEEDPVVDTVSHEATKTPSMRQVGKLKKTA